MKLAAIDGFEVEYELRGSGEPVVVIHWGVSGGGLSLCSRSRSLPSATGCCGTTASVSEAAAGSRGRLAWPITPSTAGCCCGSLASNARTSSVTPLAP